MRSKIMTLWPMTLNEFCSFQQLYYLCFTIADDFCVNKASEDKVLKMIRKIKISKAAGTDRLFRLFLWDGAETLSRPISEIRNLSMSCGFFSDACTIAKLTPIYKKNGKRLTLPATDLFLYFQSFMRWLKE